MYHLSCRPWDSGPKIGDATNVEENSEVFLNVFINSSEVTLTSF